MATKVIKGGDGFKQIEVEIIKVLEDIKTVTAEGLQNAVDATAKEVAKRTKEKSPVRTGVYKKSWTNRKAPARVGVYGRIVYNSKKPALTHLLEHGHKIEGAAFFRKNKARTDAIHHITPDKEVEEIFEGNLKKELEKELGKV